MPLGIQRLNAKKSPPNPRITFIKALKGPGEAIAEDFLERIAAQCGECLGRGGKASTSGANHGYSSYHEGTLSVRHDPRRV